MPAPKSSFWISFTPRTGSTFLCKALEQTGVAGKAGEFLMHEDKSLFEQVDADSYESFRETLWDRGCSENGVMGIKHSMYSHRFDQLANELKVIKDQKSAHVLDWHLWEELFPNCRHIYLTRRNKIRQAVSWWKAIQDEQWHLEKEQSRNKEIAFYDDKYNFDALLHLFKECSLREAKIEDFYSHNKITPFTIVYEDLVMDYTRVVSDTVKYILSEDIKARIEAPFYQKTADDINEAWVHRFRQELQKEWDRKMW